MTKFAAMRKSISLFKHAGVSKTVYKSNAVKWLKAVQYLGNDWILTTPIQKKG